MKSAARTSLRLVLAISTAMAVAAPSVALDGAAPNDNTNAVLWNQNSPEFRGNSMTIYKAAEMLLDRALADRNWTAATEQTGDFQSKPPAVILDIDETVLDNSDYQAWLVKEGKSFDPKTWNSFVKSLTSRAVPGSLEFIKYAASKGVAVFYVSNRTAEEEAATRQNLAALGYPLDDKTDTVLSKDEQKDWGSAKSTRRTVVADKYRVLLLIGDNFGDFSDAYRGSVAERQKAYDDYKAYWGTKWLVVANASYGSWESAPFNHDYKNTSEQQRAKKLDALRAWSGK